MWNLKNSFESCALLQFDEGMSLLESLAGNGGAFLCAGCNSYGSFDYVVTKTKD
jgi:hypothetical protein